MLISVAMRREMTWISVSPEGRHDPCLVSAREPIPKTGVGRCLKHGTEKASNADLIDRQPVGKTSRSS